MQMNEYQKAALRTASDTSFGKMEPIVNASMGLCGEAGEVADHLKKAIFQGHAVNMTHIAEELGDIMWYISLMAECCGFTMDQIAEMNVEKLKKRYPDGFDPERSIHRDE